MRFGERAPALLRHLSRRAVEVSHAPVVAESLPRGQGGVQRRVGQGGKGGKALYEGGVATPHDLGARLLEHGLGHPYPVGVFLPAPGQSAFLAVVPGEQTPPEARPLRRGEAGSAGVPHRFV